jgi:Rps23 Pro-64 3,4-dihydroxylase Tpa1-like proline 4-hydroxylase
MKKHVIYKNFWSSEVLNNLNEKIENYFKGRTPATVQYNIWPKDIVLDSAPILLIDLSEEEELISNMKSELNVIYDTSLFPPPVYYFGCKLHICYRGSYLARHADHGHDFVATTYLNREIWNWNWGGALLYQNSLGEINAQFPEYNKMIVSPQVGFNDQDDMSHQTTILSNSSPPRISMQIFIGKEQY